MKPHCKAFLILVATLCAAGITSTSGEEPQNDTETIIWRDSLDEAPFPADSEAALSPEDSTVEDQREISGADSADSSRRADSVQPPDTGHAAPQPDSNSALVGTKPDSTRQTPPAPVRPPWLYRGISIEQDEQARHMTGYFFNFDWNGAEKAGKKLQRIEKKGRLAPLSYLLMVGMRVFRIQNGEYEDDHARKGLLHEVEKLSQKGLELANPANEPDSLAAVDLFITGGIKGFIATLEIDKNPISAARNGFAAQKLLEKALRRDTAMSDAGLGLGLFNCVLAKAPLIVRGALNLIGKDVSLERGLGYLRRSAYHGCYTNDIAKLYLVRFLSPYWGHEANEKNRILRSLEVSYPTNPYFVFLELEENLCFHPAALSGFSFTERIKRQIRQLKAYDYSTQRYANLVKWQYLLVNQFPISGIAPDTTCNLRAFSYYPAFLQAMKDKFLCENERSVSKGDRARRLRFFRAEGVKVMRSLGASTEMPGELKDLYLWHVRDGLRVRP